MAVATRELQSRMYKARSVLAVAGRRGEVGNEVQEAKAEMAAVRIESAIVEHGDSITAEHRARLIELLQSGK
ncbi:hypothetical protein ACFUIZ_14880 [Streptomyces cinereoruber]|uniref:hypothetical protein n=1 Tax=Streptomyces cinereoruber TaxID=67260 RepID=UPI0036287E02